MDIMTLAAAKSYTDKKTANGSAADLSNYYTKQEIDDKKFITQDQLPDEEYIVDDSLTIDGAAADAKATGDRLTDVEYQPIITDFAYEHKDLLEGEKTVIFNNDGSWGDVNYISTEQDIIPRVAFNRAFPWRGITITKEGYTYHVTGTTGNEASGLCFGYKPSDIHIPVSHLAGKTLYLRTFANEILGQKMSASVDFYDENNVQLEALTNNSVMKKYPSCYVASTTTSGKVYFVVPDNASYMLAKITVNANQTVDCYVQMYITVNDNTQSSTDNTMTLDSNITNVLSFPYNTQIETKVPIAEYIKYMTENAKGDEATYITPESFGAIGNGYEDDTEAVKKCIEEAYKTKQTIFMAKTYLISSPLEFYQNGLNMIANDIIYNGTDAAFKIRGSNNTFDIHNLTSNGTGFVFTGDGEKHTYYNTININELSSKIHGIVFYFNQKGIAQNNIRFNHIKCNGTGCYGIAYLDHENKSDNSFIGENNFYGGHISHCEWACYRVAGNAKFYGIHVENSVEGGFYIIAGVRIIQPRFAESSRDGSHPFFKFINHGFCKIDSSVPLSINEIDLSENQDYYENASGAQYPAHECKVGIIEIPLMTPRTEVGENIGTPAIFTNKAYIWGKYLIMTPHMSYRKRVITNILDTRLIDKPKGTYQETWAATQALSQLPTRFVIDNVNTEIYLHASYCAFGFNEFEVEQANGFTCKIYDVHEKLIFDGTEKGDGLYKLNVYKDADICKDRAGSKGLLSLDFMGHYWQITKETTVNDILNALPVWQGGEY